MVTRPAASPPMEMSKKTCERGASGVSTHRAHAQRRQRRTLLVTLGPFFAAEAVARQATISLSGDIGTRGAEVGAGCKPRNGYPQNLRAKLNNISFRFYQSRWYQSVLRATPRHPG